MIFKHSPSGGKETWRRIEEITPPGATEAAWYRQKMREIGTKAYCTMSCGHECRIVVHTIAPNGEVSPSLQCDVEGCTFHVGGIVFEGWTG